MTNEITQTEINQATEKIVVCRIALLMDQPFWGNMATRLTLVHEPIIPTMATDGRKIYFNAKFVNSLTDLELIFVIGHEIMHAMLDHISRTDYRDKELANIAQDFAVNSILIEEHIGKKPTKALYDVKYKNWSFEEIYEDLLKNAQYLDIEKLLDQLLDQHLDGKSPDGSSISETEAQQIRDSIKEAMISAAKSVGVGKTPMGIQRLLNNMIEPKMNWRELLQQQIESQIKGDYTFMRPSRRSWHMDAILPRQQNEKAVDVTLAIDTSGSITEEQIRDFFSEVKGLVEQYQSYKINVCTWDTKLYNFQTYTEDSGEDIFSYEIHGGGGTTPSCVYNYLKDIDYIPKQLVMFSDGFIGNDFGDLDYCPVIWLIHGSGDTKIPDPAVVVKYDC